MSLSNISNISSITKVENNGHAGIATNNETESVDDTMTKSSIKVQRKRSFAGDLTEDNNLQIILSMILSGGHLGAAYYNTETAIVNVIQEVLESSSFDTLSHIIHELQPTTIVISAKQDATMINAIRKLLGQDINDYTRNTTMTSNEELNESCMINSKLEFLPSIEFSYEIAKQRIYSTELQGIPEHFTEVEKVLHMSSRLPIDCVSTIRAVGALIKYLDKMRILVELDTNNTQTPILDFQTHNLENIVSIDRFTYSALQIFQKLNHPAVHKMGTGSKDGLSLFGILNRTRSRSGHLLMKQWFNRPLQNKTELERRLDAVEYLSNPSNNEVRLRLQNSIRSTRNLPRILKRMKTGQISISEWKGFYTSLSSAVIVSDICRSAPKSSNSFPEVLKEVSTTFTEDISVITKCIHSIMDLEESTKQNQFIVKVGVDETLDKKKHFFDGLPHYLYDIAKQEAEVHREITECHVMYMRRVGYLLAIKKYPGLNEEDDLPDGLELKLDSKEYIYCKSKRTKELDLSLGDLLEEISDLEITIMHQLQNTILEYTHVLIKSSRLMAEIDCLLAFATVACEMDYVRPVLTSSCIMQVKAARHPLQELVVPLFVPNDIFMGIDSGKVILLTGPNACGKSVYLKQVGIIAFMAHIGCFVPAKSATIGLLSSIYTRIRTIESISRGMSTFTIDLNQMAKALTSSNGRSLVLVDEFGKGTATVDGVALLASSLTYWLKRKQECPLVICSTHFHCLVRQSLLPQTDLLRYYTLETVRDKQTDELVFLFQLKEGVADLSYAAHIALMAGLPRELVMRGREVSALIQNNDPIRRFDTTSTKTFMNKCILVTKKFLNLDLTKHVYFNEFLKTVRSDLERDSAIPVGMNDEQRHVEREKIRDTSSLISNKTNSFFSTTEFQEKQK